MTEAAVEHRLDAWVEKGGTRRDTPVVLEAGFLRVDDLEVPYDSIFWTSRRSGLLMLFSRAGTVALKGPRARLDEVARELGRRLPDEGHSGLPARLTGEGVVCTAGVAVSGRVEGRRVSGLRVAVVTRRGLHLLSGSEESRIHWPAEEAKVVRSDGSERGSVVTLRRGEDAVRLLYLFPEEAQALLRVADESPPPEADHLELFSRRDVAPPPEPRMPAPRLRMEALREGAAGAAQEMAGAGGERGELPPHFFETHFLELGEIALGPLLLRKSAASTARALVRAVEAMDADDLQEDTRAAVANAAGRLLEVFDGELEKRLTARRAPPRVEEELAGDLDLREDIRLRLQTPFEQLVPVYRQLRQCQRRLLTAVEMVESGPPDVEDGELEEARDEWQRALRRLDAGFESALEEFFRELTAIWRHRLLPRVERASAVRKRRLPEWLRLVLLAAATLVAAAALALFLVW